MMELLTHDGEHHEIGDGGRFDDDDDGDESPSPEPRTDSRSALPGEIGLVAAPCRKTWWNFLSDFFLPETEYMELELRSEEGQGAHKIGGCALGGGGLSRG